MGKRTYDGKAAAHNLRVHYFADTARFARRFAKAAGIGASALAEHRFPDGETLPSVRGTTGARAILVRSLHDPNGKLVEVLLAADALRRAGANHVVLVAPYLPYMRQDKVFTTGQPISQEVVGGILADSFDEIFTVETHLHRVGRLSQVAGPGSLSLSAAPAIKNWMRRRARGALVVGPDVESTAWVRAVAGVDEFPFVVGDKSRSGDLHVKIDFPADFPPNPRAVIVDDIASSGVTLAAAARALRKRGIAAIDAVVVHAIFAPGAERRILRAGIGRVISSDTVPHSTNGFSVSGLIADAVVNLRRGRVAGELASATPSERG